MKKQAVFLLLFFVVFVITAPAAFAYSSRIAAPLGTEGVSSSRFISPERIRPKGRIPQVPSRKAVVKNTSSPSFIRFRCQDANMNFRSFGNLGNVKTVLGRNSIVQLPNFPGLGIQVHEYDENGDIDFDKTIKNWLEMAEHQKSKLNSKSRHLIPRSFEGQVYFPVKVIQASDPGFNTKSRDVYGYLALDFMRKKDDSNCYQATTRISREMLSENEIIGSRPVSNGEFHDRPSETTYNGDFVDSEQGKNDGDLSNSRIFNCNNTRYRRRGYSNHSCLRRMSLKEKAQLVMDDILEINRLRPEFNIDPRFSLCMAYRESGFAPNAQGASNDSGMYQVTDSTAKGVLKRYRPVIPHFSKLRQNQYKAAMLKSTLAQADLHHMVLFEKASHANLIDRVNRNPEDVRLLQKLATRYNGDGTRARRYGQKVARCYRAMQQVASIDGRIHNPSGLKQALRKSRG